MKKIFFVSIMLLISSGFMVKKHLNRESSDDNICAALSKNYISYINSYVESKLMLINCGDKCKQDKKAEILMHTLQAMQKSKNNETKYNLQCDTVKFNAMLKESIKFVMQNNNIDIKYKIFFSEISSINENIFKYHLENSDIKSEI